MQKLDPYSYIGKRSSAKEFTFHNEDESISLVMRLKKLTGIAATNAITKSQEYVETYITNGKPLQPVRLEDGSIEPVEISAKAIEIASFIETAQVEPIYSFEEIVHFMALSTDILSQFVKVCQTELATEYSENFTVTNLSSA